jgi:ethanolamine utilization protein EutQ (cupin superfamily)
MAELAKPTKLTSSEKTRNGPAEIARLLTRDDAAGIMLGVSEFSPGATEADVNLDEILYILEGEIQIDGRGTSTLLVENDCFWMPKGEKVTFRAERDCKLLYAIIKDSPDR